MEKVQRNVTQSPKFYFDIMREQLSEITQQS